MKPDASYDLIRSIPLSPPDRTRPSCDRSGQRDARWSVKYTEAKLIDGAHPRAFKPIDLAIPMFGYKDHIGIDRTHGLIRTWDAGAANAHDAARLDRGANCSRMMPIRL